MLYELIATIAAGFVGGGLALIIRKIVTAVPRWIVPVAAGTAMLTVAVALEYSWFERTRETLPDGLEVALTRKNQALWRPWTYLAPYVDGFIAVDKASRMTRVASPETRMVDIIVFGRWAAPSRVKAIFDCAAGRRADLLDGMTLGDDGLPTDARWVETGTDHPVTRIACEAVS